MRYFCLTLLVLLPLSAPGCRQADETTDHAPGWQLRPPAPDAVPVAAEEKLPGIYPVGSRIKDKKAPGGFSPCDNYPKDLDDKVWGTEGAISLIAFPDEPVAYFKHLGIPLRLINRTQEVVSFQACDSCLFLVREAIDRGGNWREIESLPEEICGNSFHRVFLKPDQYWEFPARLYRGSIKTKIRFRLDRGDGRPLLYSNAFDGEVAKVQLVNRIGK